MSHQQPKIIFLKFPWKYRMNQLKVLLKNNKLTIWLIYLEQTIYKIFNSSWYLKEA